MTDRDGQGQHRRPDPKTSAGRALRVVTRLSGSSVRLIGVGLVFLAGAAGTVLHEGSNAVPVAIGLLLAAVTLFTLAALF